MGIAPLCYSTPGALAVEIIRGQYQGTYARVSVTDLQDVPTVIGDAVIRTRCCLPRAVRILALAVLNENPLNFSRDAVLLVQDMCLTLFASPVSNCG